MGLQIVGETRRFGQPGLEGSCNGEHEPSFFCANGQILAATTANTRSNSDKTAELALIRVGRA